MHILYIICKPNSAIRGRVKGRVCRHKTIAIYARLTDLFKNKLIKFLDNKSWTVNVHILTEWKSTNRMQLLGLHIDADVCAKTDVKVICTTKKVWHAWKGNQQNQTCRLTPSYRYQVQFRATLIKTRLLCQSNYRRGNTAIIIIIVFAIQWLKKNTHTHPHTMISLQWKMKN